VLCAGRLLKAAIEETRMMLPPIADEGVDLKKS
jgi:hypothetical protein